MKTLVMCALVLAVGCKKPTPVADKDYFGKTVAPPRELAEIRPGMTKQEALAAGVKELRPGVYGVPSGVRDVDLVVIFDDRPAPRVQSISAWVHEPAATRLPGWLGDAWGTHVQTDRWQVWQGDAWRAIVSHDPGEYEIRLWPAVAPAFWGHTPGALPAPFASIRPGMTTREIETLVPHPVLVDGSPVQLDGGDRPEGLSRIVSILNVDHALPSLLAAWGEGKVVEGHHIYDDSASGWRATLTSRVNAYLEWEPIAPLGKLLGDGPDVAALTPSPFGKPGVGVAPLPLPVTELTKTDRVTYVLDDKANVDTAVVHLEYEPADRDAIRAAFDAKWGAPTKGDGGVLIYHRGAPYVSAHDDGHEWQLVVRPTAPPAGSTVH